MACALDPLSLRSDVMSSIKIHSVCSPICHLWMDVSNAGLSSGLMIHGSWFEVRVLCVGSRVRVQCSRLRVGQVEVALETPSDWRALVG